MSGPAIPEGLEPVAVWDLREERQSWDDGPALEAAWWIVTHLGANLDALYRVEFYLIDRPFAVVRQCGVMTGGECRGEQAEPPVVVPLDELPPAYLLSPATAKMDGC